MNWASSLPVFIKYYTEDGLTTLNKWSFLSVTYDGQKVRYYLNGVQKAKYNFTGQISSSNEELFIGADYPGSHEFFVGRIDEVRIYNRVLTDAEIKTLAMYSEKGDINGDSDVSLRDTISALQICAGIKPASAIYI